MQTHYAILSEMLNMQDKVNSVINPNWREANNPWYRAIWTESAELMEHIGWKWWKNQEPDFKQAQMELVDIWHFGLSDLLQRNVEIDSIANSIMEFENAKDVNEVLSPDNKAHVLNLLENYTCEILRNSQFNVRLFLELTSYFELDIFKIHHLYVAKNVLNTFRQDNGYKTGKYIKIWNGSEDNVHLYEILNEYDATAVDTSLADYLFSNLQSRYQALTQS